MSRRLIGGTGRRRDDRRLQGAGRPEGWAPVENRGGVPRIVTEGGVLGNDLKIIDGAAAGAWIEPRLGGEFGAVTLQVPKGYEAYARVLHPATDRKGNPVRWAEVAEACGTSAHREMQWDALTGSPDPCAAWGSRWSGNRPLTGAMDTDELDALCEILSAHTADSGQCCFGLCTIEGWLDSFSADDLEPLLHLPMDRDHIVLAGPLAAIDQILRDWSKGGASVAVQFAWKDDGPPPAPSQFDRNIRESPHLIWPADHSWFVASEVDFDSTLVGGSAALIKAIVESPELEAWQVEPDTSLACDADTVNQASGG